MTEQQCPHCGGQYKRLSTHLQMSKCAEVYLEQCQDEQYRNNPTPEHAAIAEFDSNNQTIDTTILHSLPINGNVGDSTSNQVFAMNTSLFQRHFTSEEYLMINLTKLCDDANVPLNLIDSIVNVFQQASAKGLDLSTQPIRTRKSFLQHLANRFLTPLPQTIKIQIESSQSVKSNNVLAMEEISLTRYNFLEQAKDLIDDHEIWGNLQNFTGTISSDPNQHFSAKPTLQDKMVDEVHSGKWYRDTYQQCINIAGDETFLILGVICYCDKTGTDVNQRNSLEPFTFTFSIFNRECRYKTCAWRLLGYLPDFDKKSSASKAIGRSSQIGKGRATRNYHTCLHELLLPLIQNQGFDKPLHMHVRIGDEVKYCRIFFPLTFVIGDALSSDRMCGRYQAYNVPRMCRACDVSFHDCYNPEFDCHFLRMYQLQRSAVVALKLYGLVAYNADDVVPLTREAAILRKESRDELKKFSMHMHVSAFANVWFGANNYGILKATPHDMMHAFCHGILMYIIRILIAPMTLAEKDCLDTLVELVLVPLRSSQKIQYPRCNFSKGITNLTLLTAAEWVGVAFALAIVTASEKGQQLWLDMKKQITPNGTITTQRGNRSTYLFDASSCGIDEELPSGVLCEAMDILYLLEMLLSFHAWYKRGHPFKVGSKNSKAEMKEAIRILQRSVLEFAPRNCGNGWKLQKFHELLHLVDDIAFFGSPLNWDASPGEHSLIDFAKRPAKRAGKTQLTFVDQVNSRQRETSLINKAYNSVQTSLSVSNDKTDKAAENTSFLMLDNGSKCLMGSQFTLLLTSLYNGCNVAIMWGGKKSLQDKVLLNEYVIDWFRQNNTVINSVVYQLDKITIFTEYKNGDITTRAHPNYRSIGPWYDWVLIKQKPKPSKKRRRSKQYHGYWTANYHPAKVLCFFRVATNDKKIFALIHTSRKNKHEEDSILFEQWQMNYSERGENDTITTTPTLECVNVDSFGDHVLVVEDSIDSDTENTGTYPMVSVILPYGKAWASRFLGNE